MFVITFKDIIRFIWICVLIAYFAWLIVKISLDRIFKKNCYKCKHYKFFSTFSAGQYCQYKCCLKDRIDVNDMNETEHYEKCNDYEDERSDK